jgi:hypothetical protein
MNKTARITVAFIFLVLLNVSSCDLFSDPEKEKECKENELKPGISMDIFVNYEMYRALNLPAADHNALNATRLTFAGDLKITDCFGNKSKFADINCEANPSVLASGKNSYNFKLSDAGTDRYFYYFINNLDYISISFKMTAQFSDGKIYESSEAFLSTNRFKYWANTSSYTINMNGTVTWQLKAR